MGRWSFWPYKVLAGTILAVFTSLGRGGLKPQCKLHDHETIGYPGVEVEGDSWSVSPGVLESLWPGC